MKREKRPFSASGMRAATCRGVSERTADMRKNFNMLSGMVNNDMRQNLYRGDVFVFVNASNNMMKLLRYEPGGSGHTR